MRKRIINFLRTCYRAALSKKSHQAVVWEYLKAHHLSERWHSGIYEHEKKIESRFNIDGNSNVRFFYVVEEDVFHCRCRLFETFDPEMTTDVFVLATHFNNMLKFGKIIVEPNNNIIDYIINSKLITFIANPEDIGWQIAGHFQIAQDAFWAFGKLLDEGEEPAIIIADLIRLNDKKEESK